MTASPAPRRTLRQWGVRVANRTLRRHGLEVRRLDFDRAAAFRSSSDDIIRRHRGQTQETVRALREKYETPVFGRVRVWELVERLAQCVDPTDTKLLCTNQQIHVLQMLAGMERDGITDGDLVLAAVIHDLGKLLLLTDEDPANVVCMNTPIGEYGDGVGLDACTFQWNHDEFGYSRFKDHVPDHISWFIRYHSIDVDECERLMDARDRRYTEEYFRVLRRYDHDTKSPFDLPTRRMSEYRSVIEEAFPAPIAF